MSTSTLDLDTQLLADFIYALNISRRQILSYPPGHPVIASASAKLLGLLPQLLQFRSEVTIGIARNVLMVDGHQLDPANPVYRDVADSLFRGGVASLTIHREVAAEEIVRFFGILQQAREGGGAAGGIERLMSTAGLRGIQVKGIDFAAFHATEVEAVSAPQLAVSSGESAVLWKAFVTGVIRDDLDPDGARALSAKTFNVKDLAEIINRQQLDQAGDGPASYDEAITDFLRQVDRKQLTLEARRDSFGRLGQLLEQLSPETRRRFLNSTLQHVAGRPEDAPEVLADWSQDVLLDALRQADAGQLEVPQSLLNILGRLARGGQSASRQSLVVGTKARTAEQSSELLAQLFKDGTSSGYVPADYRDALELLAAIDDSWQRPGGETEELVATLEGHAVEQQFCAILLNLANSDLGPRSIEAIRQNLAEMIEFFAETGDFAALNLIHERLALLSADSGAAADAYELSALTSDAFTSRILDGIDSWGKEQYPAIRALIGRVGTPFVVPLIEHLAAEENMSRRRMFMECLQQIGPQAYAAICEYLHDPRWYLVRNLVILLRDMGDPAVLPALEPLLRRSHPKVHLEVVRTLLQFQDRRAEEFMLRELASKDVNALVNVARLTAGSRNLAIARRLAGLLNERGNSETELGLKSMIVKLLAEMAFGEVLDEMSDFIESRALFAPAALTRVKVEAITSLARYADPEAAAIAERVYRRSSGDLARAAGQVCMKLTGRMP